MVGSRGTRAFGLNVILGIKGTGELSMSSENCSCGRAKLVLWNISWDVKDLI
jgi:hypothetical protein